MKLSRYIFLVVLFGSLVGYVNITQASFLRLISPTTEWGVGQKVEVSLEISANQTETINAITTTIDYPAEYLKAESIISGDSVVKMWPDKPAVPDCDQGFCKIDLSGLMPGGYYGDKGKVLSLIFTTRKVGSGEIVLNKSQLLLNDGLGTSSQATVNNLTFNIVDHPTQSQTIINSIDNDREPPENFVPLLGSSDSLYNNKWFVSFQTQDLKSGIDYYEVREIHPLAFMWRGEGGKWQRAESPYLLSNQGLRSYIDVKAVDKAGNIRIVRIAPPEPWFWYTDVYFWIIILVLCAIMILGIRYIKHLWPVHKI